jgi:hypothetical protein
MAINPSIAKQEAAQVARGAAAKPAAPKATTTPKPTGGNKPTGNTKPTGGNKPTGGTKTDGTVTTDTPITSTATVVDTYSDPATGDTFAIYSDGTRQLLSKGTNERDDQLAKEISEANKREERQSAYDLLYSQFNAYGLGSLVTPLQNLIISGASPSEFTIKLRETEAYKKRFAANAKRIANGLAALDEADYIGLEDQYQNIMRNYGLPPSYYAKGDLGVQEGFEKFIASDVSAAELEDRVMTAQQRVLNSNPEVLKAIKDFYPDIKNGEILAYTLDPTKGLEDIKRKVTAAEIGGAAMQAGLNLGDTPEQRAIYAARAAELGAAGVTKQQAQQGFRSVAEVAPRGGQLAAIYGESPYTQQTAEQEVFGLAGSTEAAKQRKKLVDLERAAFSGNAGAAQGALGRERAGNF